MVVGHLAAGVAGVYLAGYAKEEGVSTLQIHHAVGHEIILKFMVMQVSPHRRGMRNAGKHQKMVPVMSRCKCVNLLDVLHQSARCK